MTKLLNKTAVITGAAQGLGKEISRSLARDGFNIVINYNKSKKDAEILEKELSVLTKTLTVKGDVSKFSNAQDVIKKSKKKFGRIDVLVNNAGIHIDSTVTKMTVNAWNDVINTNLGGVFNFTKAVIPIMKKQNYGRIINISSFVSFKGIEGISNYSASKAGIIGFTRSAAKEVARYNITMNSIAPGYFDIGMFHHLNPEMKKKIVKDIPAKRLGNSNEITELIQLLISSNYLTGQVFVLDGGYSI